MKRGLWGLGLLCGALGLFLFCFPAVAADEQELVLNKRSVVLWDDETPRPKPLLLFSPDFGGCATQSSFLTNMAADSGFLVVALNARDSRCQKKPATPYPPQVTLRQNAAFWKAIYHDRVDDLRRVLTALRRAPAFRGKIDWRRVFLMGHGIGGTVSLGLLGAGDEQIQDVSFRGALLFSPYVAPFLSKEDLANVKAPVMMESAIAPSYLLSPLQDAFHALGGPRFLIGITGADPLTWTDAGARALPTIEAYSLAFLDVFAKGGAPSPLLSRKFGDAALVWHKDGGR